MERLRFNRNAFTMIELLVVIAIIALLAGMLLPAIAKAKGKARTADCLNRKHQFAIAWSMYANENNDKLVKNSESHGGPSYEEIPWLESPPSWALTWMAWSLDNRITNEVLQTRPDLAPLTPYVANSLNIYRCPEDNFLSSTQKLAGWKARLRSVSMNKFVGEGGDNSSPNKSIGWNKLYRRSSDFNTKSSTDVFVIIDEHPDWINGALFKVVSSGEQMIWSGLPSSSHGGGAAMFFGDGHAAVKRWLVPETKQPVRFLPKDVVMVRAVSTDRRDFDWVRNHATEPLIPY